MKKRIELLKGQQKKNIDSKKIGDKGRDSFVSIGLETAIRENYQFIHDLQGYVEKYLVKYDVTKFIERVIIEISNAAFDTFLSEIDLNKREALIVKFKNQINEKVDFIFKSFLENN